MARILIIDDDSDKGLGFHDALEKAGHEVSFVNNTGDALAAMQTSVKFDLLITDASRPADEAVDPHCHEKIFDTARGIGLKVAVASSCPVAFKVSPEELLPCDNLKAFVAAVNTRLTQASKPEEK